MYDWGKIFATFGIFKTFKTSMFNFTWISENSTFNVHGIDIMTEIMKLWYNSFIESYLQLPFNVICFQVDQENTSL